MEFERKSKRERDTKRGKEIVNSKGHKKVQVESGRYCGESMIRLQTKWDLTGNHHKHQQHQHHLRREPRNSVRIRAFQMNLFPSGLVCFMYCIS